MLKCIGLNFGNKQIHAPKFQGREFPTPTNKLEASVYGLYGVLAQNGRLDWVGGGA